MDENSLDEWLGSEQISTPDVQGNYGVVDCYNDVLLSEGEQNKIVDYDKNQDVTCDKDFDPLRDPYLGREFNTDEEAYLFYNAFAKRKGFGIRRHKSRHNLNDGTIYRRQFVCYKEGKYNKEDQMGNINAKMRRTISREDCKARMKIKKTSEGKWIVTEFRNEHNHIGVSPSKVHRIRSHKKLSKDLKKSIDAMQAAGMRPCNITSVLKEQTARNIGIDSDNVRNYMYHKQRNYLGKDAQRVLDYFQSIQERNPSFVWAIQVDEEQRLLNIFWADARSRKQYHYFGDVIVFDTTYKTNKYELPFAPFTGVNNHMQSILFGCALLSDETEDSFIWLFKTWLAAMNGRQPIAVITDQDRAITSAVSEVFPESCHCYCMWHILKKFPEKLSNACAQYQEFHKEFHNCIYLSQTSDEFEAKWKFTLEKYNLMHNDWLESLYCDRKKWVPAYVRGTFLAGMSTTQRSEGMNAYFDNYITPKTQLHAFVKNYERALKDRRDKEKEEEYKTLHEVPKRHTVRPIEKQAANAYTRIIFYVFQEELDQSLGCIEEEIFSDGHSRTYIMKQLEEENDTENIDCIIKKNCTYTVNFIPEEQVAQCSCRMFEFKGILCRHILAIFRVAQVLKLPDRYILRRWTKNAMTGESSDIHDGIVSKDPKVSLTIRYNSLCWEALAFAEKAASYIETYDFGMHSFRKLNDQIDSMIKDKESSVEINEPNKEFLLRSNQSDDALNQVTVRDPKHATVKGRNPNSRMKSTLERKTTGKFRNCRTCKELTDHDSRTCPLNTNKNRNAQRTNQDGHNGAEI